MVIDKLPSAKDVAKYLITLASNDPGYRYGGLTNLQLQKLLYYVQGWSLGNRDQVVFRETIRAWKHGPVVREVYNEYKQFDDKLIPKPSEEATLPTLIARFIASIWEDYKVFSAGELVEKTHHEQPWLEARGDLKPYEPSDEPISLASMREFFSQPSVDHLSNDTLREIAGRQQNKPPQSWYEE